MASLTYLWHGHQKQEWKPEWQAVSRTSDPSPGANKCASSHLLCLEATVVSKSEETASPISLESPQMTSGVEVEIKSSLLCSSGVFSQPNRDGA